MRKSGSRVAALAIIALLATPVRAAEFNPNMVLDDAEMRRWDAMDYEQIRAFLANHGGLDTVYDVDPIDGVAKNAAQLISDAAKRYRVNPKYILALIQKESSAVETSAPSQGQLDWATGYALCDGCYKTAELAQKYKGFGRQVDAGAGWVEWFWNEAANGSSLKKPGEAYDISGTTVVPANVATAALYTYTPHLHGNQLLWRILDRWFGTGGTTANMRYPDGTLVRNPANGAVALIQGARFRPVTKPSVLASRFSATRIIDVPESEFARMDRTMRGRPVRFPDLSLVRDEAGKTYLLVGDAKRLIVSPQVFAKIGFNPEEVEDVLAEDIADYSAGVPITTDDAFPAGALLQDPRNGGVYWAEGGKKRPIIDRAILQANFPGKKITAGSVTTIDAMPKGDPVRFVDGVLVKTPDNPTVYVVSGGKLRAIPTETVFRSYNYSFKSVLTASAKAVALHALGEPLQEADAM